MRWCCRGSSPSGPRVLPLRAVARRRGVPVRLVAAGDALGWGELGCRVLWPPASGALEDNDMSLVAVLESGGTRLLVTGDIEAGGEAALARSGADLRADVLQLPHHGSRTSSSQVLLDAVRPRVVMAATGVRPRFDYPDPQVVVRVRALPALAVAQVWGVERVWWEDGRIVVGTPEPGVGAGEGAVEVRDLIVVAGPTGAGKTVLGAAVAERLGGEVVSADAFAVYRGMDIGNRQAAPRDARAGGTPPARHRRPARDVLGRGRSCGTRTRRSPGSTLAGGWQWLSGGTHFYVRALLRGLFSEPPRDPAPAGRVGG
ncbi:MAG: hypothetical protein AB2L07_01700 [Thermoanaerobaculaceae bacterium]